MITNFSLELIFKSTNEQVNLLDPTFIVKYFPINGYKIYIFYSQETFLSSLVYML
jgi:hypothetical protein